MESVIYAAWGAASAFVLWLALAKEFLRRRSDRDDGVWVKVDGVWVRLSEPEYLPPPP